MAGFDCSMTRVVMRVAPALVITSSLVYLPYVGTEVTDEDNRNLLPLLAQRRLDSHKKPNPFVYHGS